MRNTIKMLSWNVNGIRSQVAKDFYKTVQNLNPDILCIQETKAQYENMPDLTKELPGYEMYLNAAQQKGYSGTAILSKIKPVYHTKDIGMEKHDQEGRVITLEFEDFYLINVYVPNSGQELKRLEYRKEWDEEFQAYIKRLDELKPVIVIGDFNVAHEPIDLSRPKQNYNKVAGYTQIEIDGFKNLLNAGFVDTFRYLYKDKVQYSYWSQKFNARATNAGWRIDYFVVSKRLIERIKDSFILDQITGSDHCPVGIELQIAPSTF
jgi:exodeoxyribonuclease III